MKKSRLTKAAAESAAAAAEAGRTIWEDATEKAAAILLEAQRRAAPFAREAGKRTADFASKRLDTWEPHIRGALDRVPPAVDAAHNKVTATLLPNLQQALHKAAGHKPAPVKKKRKGGKFKKFAKFVFIGSLVAGALTTTYTASQGPLMSRHAPTPTTMTPSPLQRSSTSQPRPPPKPRPLRRLRRRASARDPTWAPTHRRATFSRATNVRRSTTFPAPAATS